MGQQPTYSPDAAHWWDGTVWRPTLSPDGRYRWTGYAWIAVRPRTVAQPTAWTRPLQRAAATFIAVSAIWGIVLVPVLLNAMSGLTALAVDSSGTMTPAEQESFRDSLQAIVVGSAAGGLVFGVALDAVLFIGCLKRWSWVFWYQMIVGLFGALGLIELPAVAAIGLITRFGLPLWAYAVSFVLDAAAAGLAVWMLVALRRYGTWACVKVPADQPAPR